MRAGRFLALLGGLWTGVPAAGVAQGRSAVGFGLVGIGSAPAAVGLLGRARWHLAREIGVTTGAGVVRSEGTWAGRGELALQFRFGPGARQARKPVWYAMGGLALVSGPRRAGWLMVGAGVEWPAGPSGSWWAEGGVAGGVRVAGGYQVAVGGRKR